MRDLTVGDVLKLARRWWWVLLLCPLVAGVAAYVVSHSLPRYYEADAILVIDQSQTAGSSTYNDIQAAQQLATTYSQLATTRPVLTAAIQQLGLKVTPEQLASQLTVAPVNNTQLLRVAATDRSPQLAAQLANTVGQAFIDQMKAQQAATVGSSGTEIQTNINTVKARIASESARITQLQGQSDAGTASVQAQITQLQSQLNQDQSTYTSLLEAQQQMDLAAAQNGTQIRIAEEAVPPRGFVRPRIMLNTAVAGVLGLLVACGIVLVVGYVDDTVKTSEEVQRLTGRTALGLIPGLRSPEGVEPQAHPNAAAAEAYRTMRTNFQFATVGQEVHSLVVTSFRPGDGKTTTLVNFGAVLAQGGQRVIIVDADLRKPQVHKHFPGLTTRTGLTNLLLSTADVNLRPLLRQTAIPGLRVLPAGPLPPNPPDVLNAPRMRRIAEQLEEEADIVLFDAPPMAVSDALILGGIVDSLLLVVTHGRTRSSELQHAVQELAQTGTPLIGVVINQVELERAGSYYAYYRAYYEAGTKPGTSPASSTAPASSSAVVPPSQRIRALRPHQPDGQEYPGQSSGPLRRTGG
ncbi:MAG TPA: polysaccharide biosynthesis tyrosine autokinase [Thermomicrobiaceae bacterium]|nr:polysaccharide biosynthesis tyrosine autokinase [Thermomicrobiaceae bacterium]